MPSDATDQVDALVHARALRSGPPAQRPDVTDPAQTSGAAVRELDRDRDRPATGRMPRTVGLAAEPRPRVPTWVVVPGAALVATVLGLAVGMNAPLVATAVLGAAALVLLLGRLEAAVVLLTVASVFSHYLALAAPGLLPGLALVTVGAWAIRRAHGRLHRAGRSPVLLVALVLALGVVVSTLLNLETGTVAGEAWIACLVVLVVLADALRARLSVETLARVYVVAAAAAALCGLAVQVLPASWNLSGPTGAASTTGPVGESAALVLVLVSALPLSLSLRALTRRAWLWDAASLVLGIALTATAPVLGLVAALAALVFAVATRQVSRAGLTGLAGATLALGGGVASLAGSALLGRVRTDGERLRHVLGSAGAGHGGLAAALRGDPVFGLGPGASVPQHAVYDGRLQVTGSYEGRSTYGSVLLELGGLGLVALLALVLVAVMAATTSWHRDRTRIAAGVSSALVATAGAAVAVGAQFSLPLWLLVAMATALGARAARAARITAPDVVVARNPETAGRPG